MILKLEFENFQIQYDGFNMAAHILAKNSKGKWNIIFLCYIRKLLGGFWYRWSWIWGQNLKILISNKGIQYGCPYISQKLKRKVKFNFFIFRKLLEGFWETPSYIRRLGIKNFSILSTDLWSATPKTPSKKYQVKIFIFCNFNIFIHYLGSAILDPPSWKK